MGAFKWFLWLFLAFSISSFVMGQAEMSYLGSYSGQAVWYPIYKVFATESSTNVGKVIWMVFTNFGDLVGSFLNMLVWNYAVLHGTFGWVVKVILFWPLSAAFFFSFILTIEEHTPFLGGGAS